MKDQFKFGIDSEAGSRQQGSHGPSLPEEDRYNVTADIDIT